LATQELIFDLSRLIVYQVLQNFKLYLDDFCSWKQQ